MFWRWLDLRGCIIWDHCHAGHLLSRLYQDFVLPVFDYPDVIWATTMVSHWNVYTLVFYNKFLPVILLLNSHWLYDIICILLSRLFKCFTSPLFGIFEKLVCVRWGIIIQDMLDKIYTICLFHKLILQLEKMFFLSWSCDLDLVYFLSYLQLMSYLIFNLYIKGCVAIC